VSHVDLPVYVMTPEFGAASQLEKIDMLDFAEVIVINKFERRGADDALRDVRRQYARNRELFHVDAEELPVFGTIASRFNDDGVTALYQHLRAILRERGLPLTETRLASVDTRTSRNVGVIVPSRSAALPGRHQRHGPRLPRQHERPVGPRPAASATGRCSDPPPREGPRQRWTCKSWSMRRRWGSTVTSNDSSPSGHNGPRR